MRHVSQELALELARLHYTLMLFSQLYSNSAQLAFALPERSRFSIDEESRNCNQQESDQACRQDRAATIPTVLFSHSVQPCGRGAGNSIQVFVDGWHGTGPVSADQSGQSAGKIARPANFDLAGKGGELGLDQRFGRF